MQSIWVGRVFFWGTVLCLLGFPIAVIGYRLGWLTLDRSFTLIVGTFFASCVFLAVASIVSLVAFWQSNVQLLKVGGFACLMLMLPVGGLMTQLVKGKALPKIHDITTDRENPPIFQAVQPLRKATDNTLDYEGEAVAKLQQISYPNLAPLDTGLDSQKSFQVSLELAKELGWEVIAADNERGRLEAVDTTLLWGFKDDVVIRISETDIGSRIDLRSVSRVGLSDLGANAKRIQAFIDLFRSRYPAS